MFNETNFLSCDKLGNETENHKLTSNILSEAFFRVIATEYNSLSLHLYKIALKRKSNSKEINRSHGHYTNAPFEG